MKQFGKLVGHRSIVINPKKKKKKIIIMDIYFSLILQKRERKRLNRPIILYLGGHRSIVINSNTGSPVDLTNSNI
jgi:hypothetical protein